MRVRTAKKNVITSIVLSPKASYAIRRIQQLKDNLGVRNRKRWLSGFISSLIEEKFSNDAEMQRSYSRRRIIEITNQIEDLRKELNYWAVVKDEPHIENFVLKK